MSKAATGRLPAAESAWRSFKSDNQAVIDAWLDAEGSLATGLHLGVPDATHGDHLLAAEANLQRAIVDFAAGYAEGRDPTDVALTLLRRAEAMLRRRR